MAHVCGGNSGNHLSLDQGASLDLMTVCLMAAFIHFSIASFILVLMTLRYNYHYYHA